MWGTTTGSILRFAAYHIYWKACPTSPNMTFQHIMRFKSGEHLVFEIQAWQLSIYGSTFGRHGHNRRGWLALFGNKTSHPRWGHGKSESVRILYKTITDAIFTSDPCEFQLTPHTTLKSLTSLHKSLPHELYIVPSKNYWNGKTNTFISLSTEDIRVYIKISYEFETRV